MKSHPRQIVEIDKQVWKAQIQPWEACRKSRILEKWKGDRKSTSQK